MSPIPIPVPKLEKLWKKLEIGDASIPQGLDRALETVFGGLLTLSNLVILFELTAQKVIIATA